MTTNPQELIPLVKAGDKQATIDLLKSIETPIYKTAYYFMGNKHDALDVTQEALLKVYTKIDTFQEKAKFTTWVQRITANICMDKFRKNKKEIIIDSQEIDIAEQTNIEKEIENKLLVEELIQNINKLPVKLRAVMILRYMQEFSYQEIAEALDLPLNTVKSYLFRGRDQLQSMMKNNLTGGVQR